MTQKRILLGHIAGAHGIRGDVLVKTYTADASDIASYGELTDQPGTRKFKLKVVGSTGKGVIVRIAGLTDRTAAEALKGTALYVDRNRLPPAEDGSYYHADLEGLPVDDPAGTRIGTVAAVSNHGAGDILEIKLAGSSKTELVPFTDAFVPTLDIAAGRVVVVLPTSTGDPEPPNAEETE